MRILGISAPYHDAAACLLEDGVVVCAIEEERIVRKKRAVGKYPSNAIYWCLKKCGLNLSDIDYVAYSWNVDLIKDKLLKTAKIPQNELFLSDKFGTRAFWGNIQLIEHHKAHASSAFRSSTFDSAAILVIDGTGEVGGTTIFQGMKNGNIRKIHEWGLSDSIGLFYEAATQYAGFNPFEAGKFMGLAAYAEGDILPYVKLEPKGYRMLIDEERSYQHVIQKWISIFKRDFGEVNAVNWNFDGDQLYFKKEVQFNERIIKFAASIQKTIEEIIFHLLNVLKEETGEENVCLSGGVALNCTCNGKIAQKGIFKNTYIWGAAHDAGSAIGAAAEVYYLATHIPKVICKNLSIGNEASFDQTRKILDSYGLKYSYKDTIIDTAKLIGEGKIGGWISGKSEFGPRALGNRSIIANPISRGTRDCINLKIKNREEWRPLAPSLLEDYSKEIFGQQFNDLSSMLYTLPILKDKEYFGAVIHEDGTTRPQSVKREDNADYYELISEIKIQIGRPLVLNTSFNIGGEPIVCRVEDAIKSFYCSSLDFLYVNGCLLCKM